MATVPADVQGPSDAELIAAVRKGTLSAYGLLYERHKLAAYNLARQLSRSQAESDDLVSEAFAKVLDTLKAGRGPDVAFRAYLLTALRHGFYDKTRHDRKLELSDDVSQISGVRIEAVSTPFVDPAVAGLERSLAARAFATLPERWREVLWYTEIEGESPAKVAPMLGLTPNGVSALAYRAREGLKQAYLQVYLADNPEQRCRVITDRLGAWTRGGLSKRETAQVEAHLDECDKCRALAAELADVNSALRASIAPLILGVGMIGYLAAAKVVAGGAIAVGAVGAGPAISGGAAAGAASSAPRQFVGVAASAAALAAAVVIGLAAGSGEQSAVSPSAQLPVAPANPAAPVPGTTNSGLRIREAPSTKGRIRGSYSPGTAITIVCQTTGTVVEGNNLWNWTDRGFISDRFVHRIGTPPPCLMGTTIAGLRIREAPSTKAPIRGGYSRGTAVVIECQTTGTEVAGNNRWLRTDRGYIADRFVTRTEAPPSC